MDRRTFLNRTTTTAALAILGNSARAEETVQFPPVNLIFTETNGGKWESKKRLHLPIIELDGRKVKIRTEHGQSEYHHIVRHTLLLDDGTVVGATTFTANDAPISEYEIPADYSGKLFATSFCNKHDLWVSDTSI
jgi:superoxide reductase